MDGGCAEECEELEIVPQKKRAKVELTSGMHNELTHDIRALIKYFV